jgi:hypothetical protein
MRKSRLYQAILPFCARIFSISFLVLFLLIFSSIKGFGQIYEPDGLRMPGDWNSWTNNLNMGGPFDLSKVNTGTARWQTSFEYTGTSGVQEFKFVSTSFENDWGNQWTGNAAVSLDALNNFQFGDYGNNSVSLINGNWYTIVYEDSGYGDTRAIFMETSAEPVELNSLSVPADIVQNEAAEVTLTLSANPSTEEIFYLRYTTDNWGTSSLLAFSMTGSSGTASIPGQDAGKTVSYYAFSSTVSEITVDYDLYTIKLNNNGGSNYSFSVAGLSSDAEILTFTLTEQTAAAVINSAEATVSIEVANGTDLSSLTPTIAISEGSSIDPASGVAQDFSAPVEYTVTAEDNTEKVWTVTVTEAEIVIAWANLQWPENGNISIEDAYNVYARVYSEGVTDQAGQGTGITAWIGFSTEDTDPANWTDWIEASYNSDQGNNDEYMADLGVEISAAGTYYYASRFQPEEGSFVYGGFDGGFWDGTNNVSGVLTVAEVIETFPVLFTVIDETESYQAIEFKGSMTNWETVPMTEGPDFTWTLSLDIPAGTYEWGAIENDGSDDGIWLIVGPNLSVTIAGNGTVSGDVSYTISAAVDPVIGWANLQWPASGNIEPLQQFNVYSQVNIENITGSGSATADLQAWIGYSSDDTDPSTWTNWVAADFSSAQGNNDEFVLDLGAEMTAEGTFYYASRFKYLEQDYVYGGFDGGFWDGNDNVSGVLTVSVTPPDPEITFANLQFPGSASILIGGSVEVYAQVEATGVDLNDTGYIGMTVWIGYSDDDTDPANWTNWLEADYNGISGFTSRPEYLAEIGSDITEAGTYYYASRFLLDGGAFIYGGFDGGFWDGVNNVSGVLTVNEEVPDPEISFANLQWPPSGTIAPLQQYDAYGQVWIDGLTGSGTATEGLQAWIGYSTGNTDPATWTMWIPADFNTAVGNNDEFVADLGAEMASTGTFYYATRFQYEDQEFVYGGYSASGGGFWDGVDNVSGVLTVSEDTPDPEIGWANLQWPPDGVIEPEEEFITYGQAWIENITGSGTETEGLQSWIGWSDEDSDPAGWTNWIAADFGQSVGNNDEFMANLGAVLTDEGNYYYASRFQYLDQEFVYGGYSDAGGGFWDGENYVSGQLIVVNEVVSYPVTFTVTDATGLYSNIKLKGEMTNWETIPMQQNGNEWTLTLDILPGSYEWGVIEDDGTPDGIWLIEGPNLEVNITPDGTITGDTTYVITYVGLAENKLEFNLYPNPAKNSIFLKSNITVEANIILTDAQGKIINEFLASENTLMMNLTGLEPGIYILHIITNNQMITKRFIKQ